MVWVLCVVFLGVLCVVCVVRSCICVMFGLCV